MRITDLLDQRSILWMQRRRARVKRSTRPLISW